MMSSIGASSQHGTGGPGEYKTGRRGEERRADEVKNVQIRREESKSFLFAADKTSHAENPEHSSKNPWNY